MANYQELANLVWNVADEVLRGLFKPHEYGDITLPFLVLRRLDCLLDEGGRKEKAINTYNQFKNQVPEESLPPIIQKAIGTSFYNTSQYDLSRLKDDPNNIHLNFGNYIGGFSTGDAGSGESEIRRWIIENDWLECIIALPEKLFFNTSIATYIWILTNRKSAARQGKIQLINVVDFHDEIKRNLGQKNALIAESHIHQIVELYTDFEETEHAKIYPNAFFGYTKVTIERPLLERKEILGVEQEFIVRDKQGNPKPDTALRDHERVPLTEDIEDYYQREVEPHGPDSWIDRKKDKVGYEINFNRYFYQYTPLRSLKEITDELLALERKSEGLLNEVLGF